MTQKYLTLDEPEAALHWLAHPDPSLGSDLDLVQVWALTGLAALARHERTSGVPSQAIQAAPAMSPAAKFALAIGFEEAIKGVAPAVPGEQGRTVKLSRFRDFSEIEPIAGKISRLIIPKRRKHADFEETRQTLYYVIVELLRNVVQHSHDPLGGVVAAQLMDKGGRYDDRPAIQVAVADNGIGIFEALRQAHPKLDSPGVALERALHPHISGTFEEGRTGSTGGNAGLGLFFIAEMAKLTAGRLLLASRGAALMIAGDLAGKGEHDIRLYRAESYAGTLATFELAINEVQDYPALIDRIRQLAAERIPRRDVHRWLRYEVPAGLDAQRILVSVPAEHTPQAIRFARDHLLPKITNRQVLLLDFQGMEICTQSYLHALLYEPLRVAWALQVAIYVTNVAPAVRSTLEMLEGYALGG